MKIERTELSIIDLLPVFPFEASFGREETKTCVLVRLFADGLEGWGEAPVGSALGEFSGALLFSTKGIHAVPLNSGR